MSYLQLLICLKVKYTSRGVMFFGFKSQEEVYKLTMQADACVVPSIWEEPCGTVCLEALALGKFVFALSRGGTPEQLRYCVFPNQLRLFEDMQSLTHALSAIDFPDKVYALSFKSEVTARIPEILNVYTQDKNKVMNKIQRI